MILHIEHPKDSIQKLFAVSYSKVGYKFNYIEIICISLYDNEISERDSKRKTISFIF